MYLTIANPCKEQKSFMESLKFEMCKGTYDDDIVYWSLKFLECHEVSITFHKDEIPKLDDLIKRLVSRAYINGTNDKLKAIQELLGIVNCEGPNIDE